MSTFDTRCCDSSSPFWINVKMTDMLRHFLRFLQLRAYVSQNWSEIGDTINPVRRTEQEVNIK